MKKAKKTKAKRFSIYLVRCYTIDLNSSDRRVVRDRTWGFYKTLARARKCVTENWTDLFENGYYNYAVIMKMPQGVCVTPESTEWYEITFGKNSKDYKITKTDLDPINDNRNKESRFKYFISW